MKLLNQDKNNIKSCLKEANNFIILTTGRAGTDFLQSCFDNHLEVASTSEKTISLPNFIEDNKYLLPSSSDVFAALVVKELFFSFAPFNNEMEDWGISKKDNYRKANVNSFIECLNYIFSFEENYTNSLQITRSIILAFSFSIGKDISNIKSILIHLHHINKLSFYADNLEKRDLIVVCSRNPFDMVASGVFHWQKYWNNLNFYDYSVRLGHYRFVFKRTIYDSLDVKKNIVLSRPKIYLSMLEKLSNINYLNNINKHLSIEAFKEFPRSSVLGIDRGGDLLSSNSKNKVKGSYDVSLVDRGSPLKRLGFVESVLLTLTCRERIIFYNLNTKDNLLEKLLKINNLFRVLLFFLLLPIPSKIELIYYKNVLNQFIKIFSCDKLSSKKKYKQILFSTYYFILYPSEYFYIRILKIKSLFLNLNSPQFIIELDH